VESSSLGGRDLEGGETIAGEGRKKRSSRLLSSGPPRAQTCAGPSRLGAGDFFDRNYNSEGGACWRKPEQVAAVVGAVSGRRSGSQAGRRAGKHRETAREKRLTARERIERLVDPGTPFFEIAVFAAYEMYREWGGAPSAGVVTGIGRVGIACS